MEQIWREVDEYIDAALIEPDPAAAALEAAAAAGVPAISVTPGQGKFLSLLARSIGARRVLEVGTLAGYSTLWLARGIPADGTVVTIEADPRHAELATATLRAAGLSGKVRLELGAASEVLPELEREQPEPFDLVFIDADKRNNPDYVGWALRLSRPGTVIIVDNVVREGAVLDAESSDPSVVGTRRTYELLAAHPRIDATAMQTVSGKEYDGFAYAVVLPEE